MSNCKLCGMHLEAEPVLKYKNMPKAAQFMPSFEDLENEGGRDLEIYSCVHCGLVQLVSEPVSYFKDVIRASSVSDDLKKEYRVKLKAFANNYGLKNKKVLEVGCGDGTYLEILKEVGLNAFGIENNKTLVKECLGKGLQVKQGFIDENFCKKHNLFAAFFMFNFLEHLPEPRKILSDIALCLNEEAVGIVEVPNLEMILQKKLFSEFIADHLCYYDKKTLVSLLEISGFEVLTCECLRDKYVLSAVVKKRKKLELKKDAVSLEALIKKIDDYVERHENIAIWGAGHQAFTLLCMMNGSVKIQCVIDSAEFKQGKYSPVTHIKIEPPEIIFARNIKNILIVAGSYNHEIVKIIKRDYNNINVALLVGNELIDHDN